jgi:hypothetical protein
MGRGGGRLKVSEWKLLGVYLYRADGTYTRAMWAKTPEDFRNMLPKIRKHVKNRLEVAITTTGDEMLFHATDKGIEWDGLGLEPLLNLQPSAALTIPPRQ